ncbi:hypothetical protein H0G86_012677 [Trichoderma simmonsii]|uniref:Uncharacterized protein n=2 Tax=Trichoderma TaxID=5543 RepID=A0A8G0PNJ7_9HYPO|nr:hypothetical protein Trihar35433_4579 [Trichoderma harzianum]QYT05795.1 hypothetical protein H0G86_012677 [Trichoderma simmonsii]
MQSYFGEPMASQASLSTRWNRYCENLYIKPSRGPTTQRVGMATRVVKPSSANNSPRSSAAKSRRRTIVNDSQTSQTARRQQQVLDYLSGSQPVPSGSQRRPVSWHPSMHMQSPQDEYLQTPSFDWLPSTMQHAQYTNYHSASQPSPPMVSYSNNTSPSPTFSPPSPTYMGTEAMTTRPVDEWQLAACYPNMSDDRFAMSTLNSAVDAYSLGYIDTTPPTPSSYMPTQPLQPTLPEAAIQVLDEPEEEGEILIGMGLYDTPGKYEEDPHLNNYRSTVSSLLGSSVRPREPTGKGLKLEETWEPPKSDNEEEDEEEEEEEEDDN